MKAVRAVVRRDEELVALGPHLVLENDEVLAPRADDRNDVIAPRLERPDLGVDGRDAQAASQAGDGPYLSEVQMTTQGPDEVAYLLALPERRQVICGLTHFLEYNRNGARAAVEIRDRERNSLAPLVKPEDYELARLALPGDERRRDHHSYRLRRYVVAAENLKTHKEPLLLE